ncbi:MAG: amidase [Cellvibrionales bacterium]|jgi:amidase
MQSQELWSLSAVATAEGIRSGTFSSREVVQACLERIEALNPTVNALTEIRPDAALQAADQADRLLAAGGKIGALHGVPTVIKGNVDLAGWPTVNGCAALTENLAATSSPCVENWLGAGAVVLGRSNTPEFCCRWETNNSVFGQTLNPWNTALTPGGSSGGTAVALAVGMVPLGHGTDLGGSLRHPAQCCGVASIKPTLGRVPDWVSTQPEPAIGVQLMNTDGPMARRVADVRLGLQCMLGQHRADPWAVDRPLRLETRPGLPIAVLSDPLAGGVHPQVEAGVNQAVDALRKYGHTVVEAEPPRLKDAFTLWQTVCFYELLNGLKPEVESICGDGLRTVFDRYAEVAPDLSVAGYHRALTERTTLLREWLGFFRQFSVLVAPVSTQPPQVIDYDLASADSNRALVDSMRMVVPINALGLPSAVVPVGVENGLPQAVQVIGAPFRELDCLAIAEHIEANTGPITPITSTAEEK